MSTQQDPIQYQQTQPVPHEQAPVPAEEPGPAGETVQLAQPAPRQRSNPPADPLAQITVRPRVFLCGLAVLALLVGLLLAILPVRVASVDPAKTEAISCGNALSGVEAGRVRDQAGDLTTQLTYLNMCDRSVTVRGGSAAILFVGGLIGVLWLGIVRRKPRAELAG